jgi:hypothetical protein
MLKLKIPKGSGDVAGAVEHLPRGPQNQEKIRRKRIKKRNFQQFNSGESFCEEHCNSISVVKDT